MPVSLDLNELLRYTDWERRKWENGFRQQGDAVLQISAGSHGDGRFQQVGELVKHIFSAEKRYVERLSGRPLTDTATLPHDRIEPLFAFGSASRNSLKQFMEQLPSAEWDRPEHLQILNYSLTATPRKVVVHVLMHEIRHWAQIATLLRLHGIPAEFHDFLFSPALGG